MNKLTRQYVVRDLDGELMMIVGAKSEKEAVARYVEFNYNEELPGYEDLNKKTFFDFYSIEEVDSI